jgi:hypothetical protein
MFFKVLNFREFDCCLSFVGETYLVGGTHVIDRTHLISGTRPLPGIERKSWLQVHLTNW